MSIIRTVSISGNPVKFARLSLSELFSFADSIQRERERDLTSLAKEQGLDKYEILNATMQLRKQRATLSDVLAFAETPLGAVAILEASLVKSGYKPEEAKTIVAQCNIPIAMETANYVVLDIAEVEAEDAKTKPEPDAPPKADEKVFTENQSVGEKPTTGQSAPKTNTNTGVAFYGQKTA